MSVIVNVNHAAVVNENQVIIFFEYYIFIFLQKGSTYCF